MNKTIETIAPRLTELMIRKIETLTEDWHKPWVADASVLPRNLRGTPYRAGNILLLAMLTELEGYRAPVFMTFKQAKEAGLNIRSGQSAFPIYFWKMFIRHKQTRQQIDMEVYRQLSTTEKLQYDLRPILRYYTVFNIDQTDLAEKDPARYAELTKRSDDDLSDGFACAGIDALLEPEGWHCPIELQYGDRDSFEHLSLHELSSAFHHAGTVGIGPDHMPSSANERFHDCNDNTHFNPLKHTATPCRLWPFNALSPLPESS